MKCLIVDLTHLVLASGKLVLQKSFNNRANIEKVLYDPS